MKKTFLMADSLLLLAACKPDGQEETLVQSIEVTPGTLQLAVGEQGTLSVEYAPRGCYGQDCRMDHFRCLCCC